MAGRKKYQMDAWMLNQAAAPLLRDVTMGSFTDGRGREIPLPQTREESEKLEIDHRHIVTKISLQDLLKMRGEKKPGGD